MSEIAINTYDQMRLFGGDRVAIVFTPSTSRQRGGMGAKYAVVHMVNGQARVTDKDAAWYNHKLKTFHVGFEKKSVALAQAMRWAEEKFGKREFVRNRMGDYVEKEVHKAYPLRRLA